MNEDGLQTEHDRLEAEHRALEIEFQRLERSGGDVGADRAYQHRLRALIHRLLEHARKLRDST
jgi:hypothetical protein